MIIRNIYIPVDRCHSSDLSRTAHPWCSFFCRLAYIFEGFPWSTFSFLYEHRTCMVLFKARKCAVWIPGYSTFNLRYLTLQRYCASGAAWVCV